MKILVGKSRDEILKEFRDRLNIGYEAIETFHKLVNYCEKPKIHLTIRWEHWLLVWTIPLLIIGLASGISIIWEMSDGGFPWLIEGFEGFKGKFLNIVQAAVMLGGCLFMIIFPFVKWHHHYDWSW